MEGFKNILQIGETYFNGGIVTAIITMCIIYAFGVIGNKLISKIIDRTIEIKGKDVETGFTFAKHVIRVIINVVVITLCLMQIKPLQNIGTALLGASSIVAVVVGLAAQETASNFIGGFFLSIYQPFKKGDLISIPSSNLQGRVQDITFRHTVIKTINNTSVIVPNSIMNNSIIENKDEETSITNFVTFSISYDADVNKAINIILEEANKSSLLIEKAKDVLVINLGASSVDLRLTAITATLGDGFTFKCHLNKVILERFKEENIEIPYQYINVINK